MTRFQRGELMEGWNDCPPLSRDSSTSSLSSRSKRRTPRPSGIASRPEAVSRAPSEGPPLVPMLPTSSGAESSGSAEKGSAIERGSSTENAGTTETMEASQQTEVDVSATPGKLRELLAPLPEKDATFLTKRLVDTYDALDAAQQRFLTRIVDGITAGHTKSELRADVVAYMKDHSGVSTWCMPLKRLVDQAGQD